MLNRPRIDNDWCGIICERIWLSPPSEAYAFLILYLDSIFSISFNWNSHYISIFLQTIVLLHLLVQFSITISLCLFYVNTIHYTLHVLCFPFCPTYISL